MDFEGDFRVISINLSGKVARWLREGKPESEKRNRQALSGSRCYRRFGRFRIRGFECVSERLTVAQLDVADEVSVDRWINRSLEYFATSGYIGELRRNFHDGLCCGQLCFRLGESDGGQCKRVFLTSRRVGRIMQQGGKGGRIIQISSQAGKNGYTAMGAYVASKHAVLGLTKTMARNWRKIIFL